MMNIRRFMEVDAMGVLGNFEEKFVARQVVHMKTGEEEVIYTRDDGEECLSVPDEMRADFKQLLSLIHEFNEKIEDDALDGLVFYKFISRYFRMRADVSEVLACSKIGMVTKDALSARQRASLARLRKAAAKRSLAKKAKRRYSVISKLAHGSPVATA